MSDVLCVIPKVPGQAGQYHQLTVPLGLAWIGAVLEREGISVKILDLQVEDGFQATIERENPKLVCLSGSTESRFEAFRLARASKRHHAGIVVAYGGPHATFTAENTLKGINDIDVIGRGEGELTVLEMARNILDRKNDPFKDIDGVSYRKNVTVIHNKPRQRIRDLDSLPHPARHLLKMDRYRTTMEIIGVKGESIITSRGCPIGCTFCSASELWGKWYTMRSPDNVLDEIERLIDAYHIEGIKFFDSTLTLNRGHIDKLCDKMIDRNMTLPWECEVRADTADRSLFEKMKKAGCYLIDIGIESGNQQILKRIKKSITIEQAMQALNLAKDCGLRTKVFLLYGLPGETPVEAEDTVHLAKELQGKVDILYKPGPVKIYPGTGVEHYAEENDLMPKGFSWSGDFYEKKNLELNKSPLVPLLIQPEFGHDDFLALEKSLAKDMYPVYGTSLKYVWSVIKNLKSKDEAFALLKKAVRRSWWTLQGLLQKVRE